MPKNIHSWEKLFRCQVVTSDKKKIKLSSLMPKLLTFKGSKFVL